jgi:hypothetical protein
MSAQRSGGSQGQRAVPCDDAPARPAGDAHPGTAGTGPASLVALGATPRISDRCTWQVVEGEAVLLDLRGKRILGLNGAGSFVLPLLDGDHTVAWLAATMAQRFGIEVPRAEGDLRAFLAELARRGYVEGIER